MARATGLEPATSSVTGKHAPLKAKGGVGSVARAYLRLPSTPNLSAQFGLRMRHKLATDPTGPDQTIEDFCGFQRMGFCGKNLRKRFSYCKNMSLSL
jgi:hypothetical protein